MSETADSIAVEAVQTTTEAVGDAEAAMLAAQQAAAEAAQAAADVIPQAAAASADVMASVMAPVLDRLDAIEARLAALTPPAEEKEGPVESISNAGETVVEPITETVENTGSLAVVGVEETVKPVRRAARFYRI